MNYAIGPESVEYIDSLRQPCVTQGFEVKRVADKYDLREPNGGWRAYMDDLDNVYTEPRDWPSLKTYCLAWAALWPDPSRSDVWLMYHGVELWFAKFVPHMQVFGDYEIAARHHDPEEGQNVRDARRPQDHLVTELQTYIAWLGAWLRADTRARAS